MSKKKPTPGGRAPKRAEVSLVRSSAAEYLSFVAATAASGQGGVEAVYADENVWLSQKMMAVLYDVDVRTISYHLKNVFADHELVENSAIQFFFSDNCLRRQNLRHPALQPVRHHRRRLQGELGTCCAVPQVATGIIESFTIKGYAMDDERLKNDGSGSWAMHSATGRISRPGNTARSRTATPFKSSLVASNIDL